MVKPVLEELLEFKAYSEKELEEMNIFELAEKFKSVSNEMEHIENKIDDLMEKYELLSKIEERYGIAYKKKEEVFTDGKTYFASEPGKA